MSERVSEDVLDWTNEALGEIDCLHGCSSPHANVEPSKFCTLRNPSSSWHPTADQQPTSIIKYPTISWMGEVNTSHP